MLKYYFNKSVIIFNTKKFFDSRGFFTELYNSKNFKKIGILDNFVQDNFSYSKKKGTLRGMHFQMKPFAQSKIIKVTSGKIQDVIVDLRPKSKTYGKYLSFILSKDNARQLYVPIGFAHGFCTLMDDTEVMYKTSEFYDPKYEKTIIWSDDYLNIKWKISKKNIIVSKKDLMGIQFNNLINFK